MTGKLLRRTILSLIAAGLVLAACNSTTTNNPGPTTAFVTMRLTTGGALDTGFGAGKGFVITDFDPNLFDFALAVAVQPDNKIVVGGSSGLAGQGQIALVRYAVDGSSLDGTFGTGGLVRTPTPAGWTSASATAIAVQPADSKIVVAALAFNSSGTTGIVVLRYNTDGTLDTTFNTTGIVTATIGMGFATDTCAMALQGTNIIVAGASADGNIVLYRYDTTGAPDAAFGTSGKTITSLSTQAMSPALAFQSTGSIIVASGTSVDQVVLRYSANGIPDTTFGGALNGIVVTDVGGGVNFANAVAVQSDDKIVVAGHANVNATPGVDTSDISLVRYNSDGTLDTASGFGASGIVVTNLGGFDNVFSMALQTPGSVPTNIVLSGNTGSAGVTQGIALRYDSNGVLDTSFGSGGITRIPLVGPSTIASANAIVFQSTLGIVVAGYD